MKFHYILPIAPFISELLLYLNLNGFLFLTMKRSLIRIGMYRYVLIVVVRWLELKYVWAREVPGLSLQRPCALGGQLERKWLPAWGSWGSQCRGHPGRTAKAKVGASWGSQGASCRRCPSRAAGAPGSWSPE